MASKPCFKLLAVLAILMHPFLQVHSLSEADRIISFPGQPQVNFQQFAGYITIDEKQSRALFYYFAEAEQDPSSKPLVLWLNGGPGCSSIGAGAFCEHGPFKPSGDILLKNDFSWNKEANMLYLESPAGVGFSYSAHNSFYEYVNDEITARDNFVFLQRWLAKFPEYKNNDLFITGESYGGHYVPQLAQRIIESKKFNLKGVAVSTKGSFGKTFKSGVNVIHPNSGWFWSINKKNEPQNNPKLFRYIVVTSGFVRSSKQGLEVGNPLLEFDADFNSRPEFLWSHGLISDSTYESFNKLCNYSQVRRELKSGSLSPVCSAVNHQASSEISRFVDTYDVTLDVCLSSLFQQAAMLNKLQDTDKIDVCVEDKTFQYLNRKDVQEALHAKLVGVKRWTMCSEVLKYDFQNLEIPTIHVLGELVKAGIRVLVYSGDQDSVLPLTGSRMLVNRLAKELRLNVTVPYGAWLEGRQVAGWTQVYGDILSFATIRGASHEAPFSQPERSLVLFQAFLEGKPLPATF